MKGKQIENAVQKLCCIFGNNFDNEWKRCSICQENLICWPCKRNGSEGTFSQWHVLWFFFTNSRQKSIIPPRNDLWTELTRRFSAKYVFISFTLFSKKQNKFTCRVNTCFVIKMVTHGAWFSSQFFHVRSKKS